MRRSEPKREVVESAWGMRKRLLRKWGTLFSDCLYAWWSEAKCTCGFSDSGLGLLEDCEEWQARNVMALAEAELNGKGEVDWKKFVKAHDWDVHRTRNHPPDWLKKIWDDAGAKL